MNRSPSYWMWLLADLSLDRAASVLPLLEFPDGGHTALQRGIDAAAENVRPGGDSAGARLMMNHLRSELGDLSPAVEQWLTAFAFTDEASQPNLFYWDSRLQDLLEVDPPGQPAGLDEARWNALLKAYRGVSPGNSYSWADDFALAARAMAKHHQVAIAVDVARKSSINSHDLAVYSRFGWNDYGTIRGLASLEIGSRLAAIKTFCAAVAAHLPVGLFETIAHERDLENWAAASSAENLVATAAEYGVSVEQLKLDVLPKPISAPSLTTVNKD